MKRTVQFTLVTLAVALFSTAVFAQSPITVNNNVVTAQVNGNCRVPGIFTLDFGVYDPITANNTSAGGAALDGSTDWTIVCTKNATVRVDLDNGALGTRQMANGAAVLGYQLYKDSGRSLVWGSGAGVGSGTGYSFTGQGITPVGGVVGNVLTIYGRVAADQDVAVGTYTDHVTAVINF